MRSFHFVTLLSWFALFSGSVLAQGQQRGQGVVNSEFIYETAPFPSCHASTIVQTSDGTLVSAWFGGKQEKSPDVGIWLSRQVNGKWTAPIEVANGLKHLNPSADVSRYPTWNPVLFQPTSSGSPVPLMLFYKVGPTPQTWWGMLMTSDDAGQTWSEPTRLPDGILGPIKNKPVQLANGDILAPSSTESAEKKSKWQVHFERSSDVGKSWSKVGPLNDGVKIEAIQPSILFLGGERLLAIGRSRQDRIFEIASADGGQTWGSMQLGTLPNNNSGIDAITLADGRHLVVYNHIGGLVGKWGGIRSPLNVSISSDGRAWQAALVLETDLNEFGYPAMIQTSDGLVHITYTWKRERIKHVVVDPNKFVSRDFINGQWPKD